MRKACLFIAAVGLTGWWNGSPTVQAQTLTPGSSVGSATAVTTPPSIPGASLEAVLPVESPELAVAALPGTLPGIAAPESALPRVFAPTRPRTTYTRYPWKRRITATVFWIGELPTENNPTPNTKSAWDQRWVHSYGGYDDPKDSGRDGFRPKNFEPGQNPFYIALPYNDLKQGGVGTKTSARHVIPWFDREYERSGKTIIRGRWLAIRRGSKVCYAQWEDVGPFQTDDWQYVFGDAPPKNSSNSHAGLDVSPAVRDYLGFSTRAACDWRFVDEEEVPDGPWKTYGDNNPFANGSRESEGAEKDIQRIVKLREMRDEYLSEMPQAQ
jgi:hypothetical protein